MEQRSTEWHSARAGKMTASRMGEAIGLIGSRKRLWRELTGREPGQRATERMQSGIDYEQVAVALYEQVTGNKVMSAGFLVHPTLDWIGGSPDALVEGFTYHSGQLGGLEVKCPIQLYASIPSYYMPQMQGLMEITDRNWWDFMVWTPDEYTITRVYRSRSYWAQLHILIADFWAYMDADVEPPTFRRGSKPKINASVETRLIYKEYAWESLTSSEQEPEKPTPTATEPRRRTTSPSGV